MSRRVVTPTDLTCHLSLSAIDNFAFLPLTADLIDEIGPWFDDPETQRFLGGRRWIQRELKLLTTQVGSLFRGLRVVGRHAWVAQHPTLGFVGFVDVEVYENFTAAVAVVVGSEFRGRGICAQLLQALDDQAELAQVLRFSGAIDAGNERSRRAIIKAGFRVAVEVNEEGDLEAERIRGTSVAV